MANYKQNILKDARLEWLYLQEEYSKVVKTLESHRLQTLMCLCAKHETSNQLLKLRVPE